jgi:hypothetical protein
MRVNDELHELVDQLDEDSAQQALGLLQDLHVRRAPREAPMATANDLELAELPRHLPLEVQEPEA